jgi:hypothetical protein
MQQNSRAFLLVGLVSVYLSGCAAPVALTLFGEGVDRQIEIELQAISSKTTRIRTVAKDGVFFKDRATATEIIL